jgi:hypothetical protein
VQRSVCAPSSRVLFKRGGGASAAAHHATGCVGMHLRAGAVSARGHIITHIPGLKDFVAALEC